MPNKRLLWLAAILTLLISLAVAIPTASADGPGDFDIPPKPQLQYPNLGYSLNQQIDAVENQGVAAALAAAESPVHSGGSVAVTIHLSGSVDDVVDFLEGNGGDPRNVGEDYIEAYVPLTLLGPLSQQPGVTIVREIVPPEPAYGNVTSQGVAAHLAPAWHDAGYTGEGVKVGVIDLELGGLTSLLGTELPANVNVRCYTDVGVFTTNLSECEAVSPVPPNVPAQCRDYVARLNQDNGHGTAVAEAIIDIAPEVTLYLAYPYSRGDMQEITRWMEGEGVTVINQSLGWFYDGPGDGTSPSSLSPLNTVNQAVADGITWVNSAGNNGDGTWFGNYHDPDGNGLLGFSDSNEEVADFPFRECRSYTFQLRWEDSWGGASTDLDLYLYDRSDNTYIRLGVEEQSGGSDHIPFEAAGFRALADSDDYGIVVAHESGPVPSWIQLTYWGPGSLEHATGSGSIGNPAESANPGMLAVGATHYWDTSTIANYSSQGPTPDGRIKPDIVGVACAASVTYSRYTRNGQDCWFAGTSQASPHVAGLAALVKQRFPDFTPDQVADYLKHYAEQRGADDPNNTWGHGFAKLPPPGAALPLGFDVSCREMLTDNGPVSGQWGLGCESAAPARKSDGGDRLARYYTFELAVESDVTINLESGDADTYLYLREGDARSGAFIAENDDIEHGSNLNSRIHQTMAAGTYTAEATTYETGETGSFTLDISGLGAEPPPCAVELDADGDVRGQWSADCESETAAPGSNDQARFARYYTFTLDQESDVTITLKSDADAYLYLRQGEAQSGEAVNDPAADDDAGDGYNSQVSETLAAGTYTIEATTYDAGETGSFILTVSGLGAAPSPDDPCREIITVEVPVNGQWAAGCESQTDALGRGSGTRLAHYYTFTLGQESEVTITLESEDADAYLYLRRGDARSGNPVNDPAADDDAGAATGGMYDSQVHQMLEAGDYTIEATTYSAGEIGSFTLTVRLGPLANQAIQELPNKTGKGQ